MADIGREFQLAVNHQPFSRRLVNVLSGITMVGTNYELNNTANGTPAFFRLKSNKNRRLQNRRLDWNGNSARKSAIVDHGN